MSAMPQDLEPVVLGQLVTTTPPIVKVTVPGGAEKLMRIPSATGLAIGDTLHVQLKIDPRATVLRCGDPAIIGPLTTFDQPAPVAFAAPTAQDANVPKGLRYVGNPEHFYVAPELVQYFAALHKLRAAGRQVRGRLIGPTGVGKSTAIYSAAASWNAPFLKLNMASIQSPEQLLGRWTLTPDGTVFQETALVRALQYPGSLIFFEEVNRTHSSNANILMDLLDAFGETWIDELGVNVKVDPSVAIFGAMNVGSAYTGTFDMDLALESRFEYPIELSYLPELEEAKVLVAKTGVDAAVASGMVQLANDTRQMAQVENGDSLDKAISTRTLLAACDLVALGHLSPAQAVQHTVLPLYSLEGGDGSQRAKVAKLVQGKFSGATARTKKAA